MAKRRRFRHLSWNDRLRIEAFLKCGKSVQEIADEIGVHRNTIYNELKRGRYTHRNSDWTEEERYSPDIAEAAYREHLAAKGPDLKIGKDYRLAEYIERRIVEDGYSPAAVLGEIKVKGIQFNTTICEATLYSYIKKGVFLTLEMVHLPCKGKQKRPYTKVKKNKKAARASAGKSIEKRDPEIDTREEVGHWEMDCVEGKKKTKETLLVLSERKARKEIMIKMKDQTAGSVVAALDRLERRYGTLFYKIFQTITVDNGSEFADVEGLERSCRRKGKRTTVFYCHPYSSYERGTNENINRMIRRWFPKGTDFGQVPKKAIQAVEDWLNAYPREILGFRSADEVFADGCAEKILTFYENPLRPDGSHALGLKIRFTRRPLTTMDLTKSIPSAMRAILGSARAEATTAASSLSVGTTMLARTLPPTWTAICTVAATVLLSSYSGHAWRHTCPP